MISDRNVKVFIGFDKRQPVAFHTLAYSIWKRCSRPVSIQPLKLEHMPTQRRGLTEFTYSRFLTPYLSGYRGFSIFLDSDILCLGDVCELVDGVEAINPVSVSKNRLKYEWASVMVFNNNLCEFCLTPKVVGNESNQLYDFAWANNVGSLDPEWNHLVGYDKPNPKAKLVHFTQGIPCFAETKDSEFAAEWQSEADEMCSTVDWKEIMGNSVHARPVLERLAKSYAM